jgi:hypothetical protein
MEIRSFSTSCNPRQEGGCTLPYSPIFRTDDISLPLFIFATNVRHVYGILRPSKTRCASNAALLELMPAFLLSLRTDDGSLPLRFAATYVRHVYGIVRASKSRGVSKAAPAADVREMLKSALSHAAKLAHVWPDTHRWGFRIITSGMLESHVIPQFAFIILV